MKDNLGNISSWKQAECLLHFTMFDAFSSIYLGINEDVCWFTKFSQKTVNFLVNNLNISDCDLQHIKVSGLLLSHECSLRWFIKRACSLSRLYFHPDTNSTLFDSTFFHFYIKYNISVFNGIWKYYLRQISKLWRPSTFTIYSGW